MSQNIWINIILNVIVYIRRSFGNFKVLFFNKKQNTKESFDYTIIDELFNKGPQRFDNKPSAIKLGRALFVPFILISRIYESNSKK